MKHAGGHFCTPINTPRVSDGLVDRFESEWECAHGRIEQRIYEVFEVENCLRKFPEWKEIRQMIRVLRIREIKGGKKSIEEYIYVCNDFLKAKDYAKSLLSGELCLRAQQLIDMKL